MPKVITYSAPQVEVNALPNVRQSFDLSPDMFGAAQGRAFSQGGQALQQAANQVDAMLMEKVRENDKRSLLEIEDEVRQWERTRLWDEKTGAYSQKGGNAKGLQKNTDKDFQKSFHDILSKKQMSLSARFQAESFMKRKRENVFSDVGRHETREMQAYDKSLIESSIAGAIEDAVSDPSKMMITKKRIHSGVVELSRKFGLPPEASQEMLDKHLSTMHTSMIERKLALGDVAGAKEHLQDAIEDGELEGTDATRLTKIVEAEHTLEKVQSIADRALIRYEDDEAGALSWAEKNLSGEEEKQAKAEIKNRFATKRRLEKEALEDRQKQAREQMSKGTPFRQLPQDLKAAIMADGSAFSAAMAYETNVAKMGTPHAKVDHSGTETKLNSMTDNDLVKEDLSKHIHNLTESTYQGFVAKQKKAKERLGKMQTNPAPYKRGKALLKDMSPVAMNFGSTKAKDNQKALANQAVDAMNGFVDAYIDQGKVPTDAELRKEAARLMMEVEADPENTDGLWLPKKGEEGFSGYSFQTEFMSEKQINEAFVPYDKITDTDKKTITDALTAKGWTAEEISKELVEAIAGAYATRNLKRMSKLLEKTK